MAFAQKTYVFSHAMSQRGAANQPVIFPVDLGGLISPLGECSPMFVIERVSLRAHRRDTGERIPAKFAVLNDGKTRVVADDPSRLSSKWKVDVCGTSSVKIAGTEETPFQRALSAYDEDNRQCLLNVLAFMATGGAPSAGGARRDLDALKAQGSRSREFSVACELCGRESAARVVASRCDPERPALHLPLCADGLACVPERPGDPLGSLIALLRAAYADDLSVVHEAAELALSVDGGRLRQGERGVGVFPYPLMNFVVSLYGTLSEQADNFVVVDRKAPNVKVLVESPSDDMGYVAGSLTLTLLYGASVLEVYGNVSAGAREAEGPDEPPDAAAAVAQFGCDASGI